MTELEARLGGRKGRQNHAQEFRRRLAAAACVSDVTVAPNDALLEKLNSNMQEVRARGGALYVFADAIRIS